VARSRATDAGATVTEAEWWGLTDCRVCRGRFVWLTLQCKSRAVYYICL